MNLYHISQKINKKYNTYDSAIVCADNEEEAKNLHPNDFSELVYLKDIEKDDYYTRSWVIHSSDVICKFIGIADSSIEKGIVLSSFIAG